MIFHGPMSPMVIHQTGRTIHLMDERANEQHLKAQINKQTKMQINSRPCVKSGPSNAS